MRRHAKASTAASTQRQATNFGSSFGKLACLAGLSLTALLLAAAPALGATVTDERPFLFSFDGSDTTAGRFGANLGPVAVDSSSGSVYVLDQSKGVIDKFDANGQAQDFASIGASSLDGSATPGGAFAGSEDPFFLENFLNDLAVDNSGGAGGPGEGEQGRIYISGSEGPVHAFDPQGDYLWTLAKSIAEPCGIAVGPDGHLWIGSANGGELLEFDTTGKAAPGPPEDSVPITNGNESPCRIGIDDSGKDFYLALLWAKEGATLDKYVEGVFDSTLDPSPTRNVAVDQSSPSGHVFAKYAANFKEYDAGNALVGTFGTSFIGPQGFRGGISHNPALDWVYVSGDDSAFSSEDAARVNVFGPKASGTVPDVTIEAASEIGVSKVKANGAVNPLSLPNSYHFELKQGGGPNWGAARSSAPDSLAEDSSVHPVSKDIGGLSGNTEYQVRLVGTNAENDLKSYSAPVTFTTAMPSAATATIDSISSITVDSAHLSGTIDPKGDAATWRVQKSTNPACTSGFTDEALQTIPSEAPGSVDVDWDLGGLLPSQHYCVRIVVTNGAGSVNSTVEEFSTAPIAPTQVFTAFAAPRTDTTARLNGRVNPEGANSTYPLTYHFEYSSDGGGTWISLPEHQYTGEARQQVVVAHDLGGLKPDTEYRYRFRVENAAGEASPQGGELTFMTRTTEEANPPERGIELVNDPDKGNQNVVVRVGQATPPMTADGEKVVWSVLGGAPAAHNGTRNTFLAQRGPKGWVSQSLIPPASQQVGGGEYSYELDATTPDLSQFLFSVGFTDVFIGSPTYVRIDENQHQKILEGPYENLVGQTQRADLSDDGSHVVLVDPDAEELEDIGSGSPELLSLMPDGSPVSCPLSWEWAFIGGSSAGGAGANWRAGYHMIATTDGSRVYFEAKPNGNCSGSIGLYVRNRETEETTQIDPGGSSEPQFIRATPNGRSAYFTTTSTLDPVDTNVGRDVYRWDEAAGQSSCMTCMVSNANVRRYVLVSDDFSHIYFESENQLIAGKGEADAVNLYVVSGGSLRFVAHTANSDGTLPGRGVNAPSTDPAELSEDGTVLLFEGEVVGGSHRGLTADKVAAACPSTQFGATGTVSCRQLYRYDDIDGSVECVSCLHGGVTARKVGAKGPSSNEIYAMSADGGTVAFVTEQRLLPVDVNDDADVYEWINGRLRLVTDGVSDFQVGQAAPRVFAVDADGGGILFAVAAPNLTGFEEDGLANLYQARIGGGFEPIAPTVHCKEESCQGPLQAAPAGQQPGSASFHGTGNPSSGPSRRCSRGAVRRGRRCVSKRLLARRACLAKRGSARRSCLKALAAQRSGGAGKRRADRAVHGESRRIK